jgi:hypothetical protein
MAVHLQPKGGFELIFCNAQMTPEGLTLKFSWDKKAASQL